MAEKEFVRADDLVRDSFALARRIYDSGFRPDALVVLWRGGTPVGIAIHEFLLYRGVRTYHTAIKAESYTGIGQRTEPRIENLEALRERLPPASRVLVIDDIFDSGRTVEKVCELLRPCAREIRVATLYYKEGASQTTLRPDYYLRQTDRWIVFPHEIMDLTPAEIRRKDAALAELLGLGAAPC